jgi:hypothetical protein
MDPQPWTSTPLTLSVSNIWYTATSSWNTSIYLILSWFITLSHVPLPLLWSYQRISPGWKHMYLFRVYANFYGEDLLVPRQTSKLEDHTLSAVRDCLFNIFAAIQVIGGRSSRRDLRMQLAMVTGTHLSWDSYHYVVNIKAIVATCVSFNTTLCPAVRNPSACTRLGFSKPLSGCIWESGNTNTNLSQLQLITYDRDFIPVTNNHNIKYKKTKNRKL